MKRKNYIVPYSFVHYLPYGGIIASSGEDYNQKDLAPDLFMEQNNQ